MAEINAAIDVETTGLSSGIHEIVQIAVIPYKDYLPFGKFVAYVKPFKRVDPKALEVNGLTMEMLNMMPTPAQVRACFLDWKRDFLGPDKITPLGHNYGGFDLGFLKAFFSDDLYNSIFDYHYDDSMIFARGLIKAGKLPKMSCSLKSLKEHFKIESKAHDAYEDAVSSLKVYERLVKC